VSLPPVHDTLWQRLASSTLADWQSLHVFLQIQVEVFKHEVQLMPVGVHNVEQTHDVRVAHLLEERDLANGGGRHAFVLGLQPDLLQGDDAVVGRGQVARLVHDAVCAWLPS
jgi:hypothetical protein